jgi:hypothetical protein
MDLIAHLTHQEVPLSMAVFLAGLGFGVAIYWALVGYLRRRG